MSKAIKVEQIEELLHRLVDHGPMWYRGEMSEEGRATRIIVAWMVENDIPFDWPSLEEC